MLLSGRPLCTTVSASALSTTKARNAPTAEKVFRWPRSVGAYEIGGTEKICATVMLNPLNYELSAKDHIARKREITIHLTFRPPEMPISQRDTLRMQPVD